jgi:pSer/pThr/pTyr-binding forkhead associated (FHA) protein
MRIQANGELMPTGGGDNIPLIREKLSIGRRDSCDVCLRFANISSVHAEMNFRDGYWYIRDCNSTNGVKVNGVKVQEKLLHPKDRITIGKRDYFIRYDLPADHVGRLDEVEEDHIMGQSLLERAGLAKPQDKKKRGGFDPADFLLEE